MLLEYQLNRIKIVDFLLIAKFLARELFFCTPSTYIHIKFFNENLSCRPCRCGTGTCGCDWMKYAKAANVSYQTFLELIISVPLASIWIHTFKMSTLKSTLSIQNAMSSLGILTSKKFYLLFNYFYELLFVNANWSLV